jgi:LacI family transcriptional regulator
LVPDNSAARWSALGRNCDAVAVIAADHPLIGQTIQQLSAVGKPVVTYITDLSAHERAAFVGTDNWRVGRTAAWLIAQMTHGPGRVAVFIGHHRYQCQDVSDASFRSYLREHAPRLIVEESRPTHEDAQEAYQMVKDLLATTEDLAGILIVGGGISGVLKALREAPESKRKQIKLVCRDIGPETRKGLSEGIITAALCHPWDKTSNVLIQTMIDVVRQGDTGTTIQRTIPFEIFTPENI